MYGPEIMPLAHRAKGEGLATACLWLSAFVVVEIVPVAISHIGWRVYLIFACCNLAFLPVRTTLLVCVKVSGNVS